MNNNCISLIIFFDGANFAKTGKNGSQWAMFSMIEDLTLHGIQTLNQTFKIEVIGLSFVFL